MKKLGAAAASGRYAALVTLGAYRPKTFGLPAGRTDSDGTGDLERKGKIYKKDLQEL